MDRRKFLKFMGVAPAVPIAMKVSSVAAEIFEPRVIQETNSGIVIANHMPSSIENRIDTRNESVISYSIQENCEMLRMKDENLMGFKMTRPGQTSTTIDIKIYGKDDSQLAQVQLNDTIYLLMNLEKDMHQPGIYKEYHVICSDKMIEAEIDNLFMCTFTFLEVHNA